MNMQDLFDNEQHTKLLNDSIGKSYYRYKLQNVMELDDFTQECYFFMINRIEKFDETRATLNTYIPRCIMSCAKRMIQNAQGRIKDVNKLESHLNSLRLDCQISNTIDETISNLIGSTDDDIIPKLVVNEILNSSSLSVKQRAILELMSKGYTRKDVSEILRKDITTINITFDRARQKILRKYSI